MPTTTDSAVFVHPTAICEAAEVGAGTRVWAFAHVLEGASIGRDCNLCDHVFIEGGARLGDRVTVKNGVMVWDGVTIEDDVFCGPGMLFTNDRHPRSARMPEVPARYADRQNWLCETTVRRGATLGAGSIILCGLSIGRYASVAAGAIVTRDVPDHRLVVGQPARIASWVCVCGAGLGGKEHLCSSGGARRTPRDDLACGECDRRYRLGDDTIEPVI